MLLVFIKMLRGKNIVTSFFPIHQYVIPKERVVVNTASQLSKLSAKLWLNIVLRPHERLSGNVDYNLVPNLKPVLRPRPKSTFLI